MYTNYRFLNGWPNYHTTTTYITYLHFFTTLLTPLALQLAQRKSVVKNYKVQMARMTIRPN